MSEDIKILNKVSKIVVTKLKNKYCFLQRQVFTPRARDLLMYFGPIYEVFHTTRHLRGKGFGQGG